MKCMCTNRSTSGSNRNVCSRFISLPREYMRDCLSYYFESNIFSTSYWNWTWKNICIIICLIVLGRQILVYVEHTVRYCCLCDVDWHRTWFILRLVCLKGKSDLYVMCKTWELPLLDTVSCLHHTAAVHHPPTWFTFMATVDINGCTLIS